MTLTPVDIHNMAFTKSSLGRRGYDEEQVDAFLDAVTQEMIQLLEQNDELRRRAPQAVAAGGGAAEAELSAVTAALGHARQAWQRAEHDIRVLRTRLDQVRDAVVDEPPAADGKVVLAMARHTAEEHVRKAGEQSHAVHAAAQRQSDLVIERARRTVEEIETDSRRHQGEATARLQASRTAAQREIDELAGFARDYRAALKEHFVRFSGPDTV
jgi:DivIVA domain-containing protein